MDKLNTNSKEQPSGLALDEVKRTEVDMLNRVTDFCTRNNLTYSFCGGTLLGAIRHQGFIPWDDDIDICLPRPDYEKLIELKDELLQETRLEVQGFLDLDPHKTPFIKVVDRRYRTQIETDREKSYLWIDVFPVDGLPASDKQLAQIYKKANFYRRFIFFLISTPESKESFLTRTFMRVVAPIARAVPHSLEWANAQLDQINKSIPYNSTPYAGIIGWGLYGTGERFLVEEFEKSVPVTFEDRTYTSMSCWDSYLSGVYGDYMQLPPESERKTHLAEVTFESDATTESN